MKATSGEARLREEERLAVNQPRQFAHFELLAAGLAILLGATQLAGQADVRKQLVKTAESAKATSPASGELKCAVVEWNADSPKPTLTVVCPPEDVFAPLRLYLGLSREREERVADDAEAIAASPKSQVRVRFTPREAQVRLKVLDSNRRKLREAWVRFDTITKIGFATEP